MSGLYGNLPQAKNASDAAPAWGAVPKLQPQLRKPSTPLAPPPSVLRAGRGGGRHGPPPAAGRGAGRGPSPPGAAAGSATPEAPKSAQEGVQGPGHSQQTPLGSHSLFAAVKDEYDPMRPNDYEEVLKERERAKREAEIEAERIARVKEMEATMERLRKQEEGPSQPVRDEGAFPPPPSLDVSGEEAFAHRARLGATGLGAGAGQAADGAARAAAEAEESERGMTLAQKMLRKMGWKEGEGLGRNRQGIASPLVMQKTNARAGVIVEGAAAPTSNPQESAPTLARQEPPEKKPRLGAAITGTPTHVLCLRNMVGPGEVDDELEEEVGVECTKYGAVTDVMIFEVTAPGYPSEEAVRIFVQFERVESATKALVDLQGRYFAGRNVRVAFFSEERFQSEDLAPKAGEFD